MDQEHERLEQAVTVFSQAARLLDGPRLHVWDERGLTLPQLRILFQLRQQPGAGVKELAQLYRVSASNITQQVDKLVARRLVARGERQGDRRQVCLTLTVEGAQVASEISQAARTHLRAVLSQLAPSERDTLVEILGRVVALAGEPAAIATR